MDDIERAEGPDGEALVLRHDRGGFVVLRDGQVVLRSAARRSERELVNLALVPLRDRNDVTVLLGGLGMGHTLRALLADPRVVRVDVVEHAAPLIEWNRSHLSVLHDEPPLSDERVHVHQAEFSAFLRALQKGAVAGLPPEGRGFLALILDLDDGPGALFRAENAALYQEEGLSDLEAAICPGGVLGLWSIRRESELLTRLRGRFQNVAEIAVPVDLPAGAPGGGLDYVYRCRRRAAITQPGRN